MHKLKIGVLVGSLKKESVNRAVFETVKEICPKDMELNEIKIGNLPLFNQDYENDLPRVVINFKKNILESDAILFITPEYNYSVPGSLKNAIDWGSRPYGDNSWNNKPATIMSASGGMLGGVRAQYHLRQMFVFVNIVALNMPEVMIPRAPEKIENGKIIDEYTIKKIAEQLEALKNWTKKWNTIN